MCSEYHTYYIDREMNFWSMSAERGCEVWAAARDSYDVTEVI